MQTECSAETSAFGRVEGRPVVAEFDGGALTSDAGGLLLGSADRTLDLVRRLSGCFRDARDPRFVEHSVATLIGQRVFGIALGYEDLNDHDELRHDPLMAVLAGKLKARREDCAPVAGKSTLNRLELSREVATRYHKISHDPAAIEALFVDLFLKAHARASTRAQPPRQIILDLDATDDPLHGHQEGRFFHGYYDCYCYLPLYVFCGRHLLAAKLRPSNIDGSAGAVEEVARIVAQIRARWPRTRVLLRADSGFAREVLMVWCEENRVDFVFGLARNARLVEEIAVELLQAEAEAASTGKPARRYKDFRYATLDSWSRRRRVIGKAEWTQGEANPRFIVTSLSQAETNARFLYEKVYCARGDMENRIKECQGDLFADRTSTATMRSNQLRLWLASFAYVLICAVRRIGLAHTQFAEATCGTIRLKLLKLAGLVRISTRRIKFALASACPYANEWRLAAARLGGPA
ncbi:MAG TPA: IS1380 family transposase [Roseiarcus sp.]|nr:IS1380 family transposase [Roseiarcus sp.]